MSRLIDSVNEMCVQAQINGVWYIAKPMNYRRGYSPLIPRLKDAWRVLRCRSIAVHFKQDEIPEGENK